MTATSNFSIQALYNCLVDDRVNSARNYTFFSGRFCAAFLLFFHLIYRAAGRTASVIMTERREIRSPNREKKVIVRFTLISFSITASSHHGVSWLNSPFSSIKQLMPVFAQRAICLRDRKSV